MLVVSTSTLFWGFSIETLGTVTPGIATRSVPECLEIFRGRRWCSSTCKQQCRVGVGDGNEVAMHREQGEIASRHLGTIALILKW
jgi:hypothetical protein